MIPTNADTLTHEVYVQNIIAAFDKASEDQERRGRDWYPFAQRLAAMMADGNVSAGAGVIAALSPQKAWYLNVRLAERAFATGEVKGNIRNACEKAERIMLGADPLEVLPTDSKTWNFYRCIVDLDDAEAVVIDRHAADIATGAVQGSADRGLSNKRRYATLAHAYREAARRLGEVPSTVQAVGWIYWTESVAGVLPRRPGLKNVNE
jgi:hypothetical protein